MVSHEIISKLRILREYALAQGARAHLEWKAEDSHLVRYANSAISLNTNEHLTILEASVIIGILLMFSASGLYIEETLQRLKRTPRSKRGAKTDTDKAEEERV
jgi:hypothetical protein